MPASACPEIFYVVLSLRSLVDEIRCCLDLQVTTWLIPFNVLVQKLLLLLTREIKVHCLLSRDLVHKLVHIFVLGLFGCPAHQLFLGLFDSDFMI